MRKLVVKIEHDVEPFEINDIMTTALEGGINYWCNKVKMVQNEDGSYLGVSKEDQASVLFASDLIGYGGKLILFDAESDEKWELTLEKMLKGIEKFCVENNNSPKQILEDCDAGDADCIVQFAVFDEIVFG